LAATWIKALHVNKGKSIARTLADRTGYAENPDKTKGGKLVTGYACDPRTADEEFMISKREYDYITDRDQGRRNVLAYHIRQSFKPGEIDAEMANEIGYKLAMSFTKGEHAFIVATHIDKAHTHNHIVFNSTALNCEKKFKDFKRSGKAVRNISDVLCLEHGLSVIENPGRSKGRNYAKWLGDKPPSWQEKLRQKIDEILPDCSTFEDFLAKMKVASYVVKNNRKHISLCAPGQKRPTRLKTLGEDYTETAIRERIGMPRTIASGGAGGGQVRVNLLIDIQAKIREGKGAGYEQWARIFNIKQAAKTLLFLKEHGIDSYDDLVKKSAAASADYNGKQGKINEVEKRLAEISELQKHIGTYGKTREVFAKYKASKWNPDFYEEHRADITLHRAAKKYFDGLGLKKLPSISSIKQEYAALAAEKKKLYACYYAARDSMRALLVARGNADRILGVSKNEPKRDDSRAQKRSGSWGI